MNVMIYTSPTCGYCHQAKAFLTGKGIEFTEVDVSRDRAAAGEVMRLTGQMGVPVIVVDGEVVIGFNRPQLEALLAKGGGSTRPHLGLKVADASSVARKAGAIPVFGALVGAVAPGSVGERIGFRSGDIITEVNLRPVNNAADLEQAMSILSSGSKVTVVFLRGGKTLRAENVI